MYMSRLCSTSFFLMAEYRMPVNPSSTPFLTFESNRLIGFNLENLRGWLCSFLFSLSLARKEGVLVAGHRPAVLSPICLQWGGVGKYLRSHVITLTKGFSVWEVSKPLYHWGLYSNTRVFEFEWLTLAGVHQIQNLICFILWFRVLAASLASPWCLGSLASVLMSKLQYG